MFSGIVQSVGTIALIEQKNEKARMKISVEDGFRSFELGESIAVNGVCLTVTQFSDNSFSVDLTTETLSRTGFKQVAQGDRVNLERSLTLSDKISGHFVMGHVDQVGTLDRIERKQGEILLRVRHPQELRAHIIEKGSIALDGISLTIFSCKDDRFSISIIPHTWEHTNLKHRKEGDAVNLECDMIGKYVHKACETLLRDPSSGSLTVDFLKQNGFK